MDCPDSCALDVIVAEGKIARIQASLPVTPRSEVLDMEIADAQNGWCGRQLVADFWPQLNPPVESGTQEREWTFCHSLVLDPEIRFEQWDSLRQPTFVRLGCLLYVHVWN